jgi:hypothetical protein
MAAHNKLTFAAEYCKARRIPLMIFYVTNKRVKEGETLRLFFILALPILIILECAKRS